jgi:hypothetical protein
MGNIHILWLRNQNHHQLILTHKSQIGYKTTNTIKHLLKPRHERPDIYNQSGIYQLQCGEWPLKYIGQTGRTFRVRYREHLNAIRINKQNSKFAQHILETGHDYDTIDQSMKVLHTEKKGPKLNKLQRFNIYHLTKRGLQMKDTFTDTHNPIFDILNKTNMQITPSHHTNLPPTHTQEPQQQTDLIAHQLQPGKLCIHTKSTS